MRTILLLLDGLGDRGHGCFGGKTPLQAAHTPNLDHIAKLGMNGLYHSYIPGIAMSSELAHVAMFGYHIGESPGRGAIEAAGFDVKMKEGEVALLARIFSVTCERGMLMLEIEDPDVDPETCQALHQRIGTFEQDGVVVEFVPTKGIEGILVLRGEVSDKITDSNPIYEGRPLMEVLPHDDTVAERTCAIKTADVLNRYLVWCHQKLSGHPLNRERERKGLPPINALGTQKAGKKRQLPSFSDKWGLRGLSISSEAVYHGLSRLIGMEVHKVKEGIVPEKDLLKRLEYARQAVDFDFIHVHTKAPDTAAHTKSPEHKRDVIESVDRALAYAVENIITDDEILFVVTSDHATPSSGNMIHSGEAVPVTIRGKNTRMDHVTEFNEISSAAGALGHLRGVELMYLILNFMDRGKLWGLMDTPKNQPFFPGNYKPLKIQEAPRGSEPDKPRK